MTESTPVSLNLQSPNISTVVYAVQNDRSARHIVAQLRDGSAPWTPPAGAAPVIRYVKPDGTGGFYDADDNNNSAIVISGSKADMTIVEQALTVPGDVYMQLHFYAADGTRLTSFAWILRVQQSVLNDATIVSSDYFNVLTAKVSEAVQAASAAAESAAEAAASAASISIPLPIASGGTGATTDAEARENIGLGNVANERQYSAQNPPPYPVKSVNGQTGDVTVQAATDAQVSSAVNTWLGNNVDPATGYLLDSTLSMGNAAPPASAVGAVREIADAVGMVFPYVVEAGGLDFHADRKPTVSTYLSDRRAHTSLDFPLKLVSGTVITPNPYFRFIVMYTTDGSTYANSGWITTAYTVPIDMAAYLTLASIKSGEPDILSPETLANSYTITLPNGKTGLLGDVAELKNSVRKTIYCGSTREYTTLKSAIEEATKYMDAVVYVDAETFDLKSEFGTTWLENYAEEANCGLFLKNRVHVIFASGAKVVFNYTGANEYIQRRFSPFNAGEHGFILENAWVESTNCRYSVHDERGTQTDPYHNIYKRCTFIHDSTGTTWGSHQAIGGGLGKNGDILIEDCYLITAGTATTVSYHNSAATDAESSVVLKDSYLSSTVLISNYGTSTKKTRMIVTNCSLGFEPIVSTEAQYADNVELVKWNNNIRS